MQTKQSSPSVSDSALRLPGDVPELPSEVMERFPAMREWADHQKRFWRSAQQGMQEFARAVLDVETVGNVLFVDPNSNSLYVKSGRGEGFWADPDTAFYVDSRGYLSLKNQLTFNPDSNELTVEGTIVATAGEIGGFEIGSDYIRDANDSMGLASTVTGGDDVRFWSGSPFANRATAPFRVTEAGVLTATNATISGSITATSGTIGGWTIGATTISANNAVLDSAGQLALGTGNDIAILSATNATYRLWIGNATAGSAAFSVTKAGVMTATNGVFSGTITSSSGTIGGFTIGASTLSATGISINSATPSITVSSGVTAVTISNSGLTLGAGSTSGTATGSGISFTNLAGQLSRLTTTGYLELQAFSGQPVMKVGIGGTTETIAVTSSAGSPIFSCATINATTLSGNGSSITSLNASNLSSGTVATARLGSGTANSGTWLRGDQSWQAITAGAVSGLAASATTDTTNASNISSGTLNNSRLPSAISVTSLTLSSTSTVSGTYFGSTVPTFGSSLTEQSFTVSVNAKATAGFVGCSSDNTVIGRYDWDASSASSAVFKVRKLDGSSFSGSFRFSYHLIY